MDNPVGCREKHLKNLTQGGKQTTFQNPMVRTTPMLGLNIFGSSPSVSHMTPPHVAMVVHGIL